MTAVLAGDTARYLVVWIWTVLLPGALLWRALIGRGSLMVSMGFGSVLGLAWGLGVWAVFTGLGRPGLQWLATAALVGVLVLVPRFRHRLKGSAPRLRWLLLAVVGLVLAAVRVSVELLRLTPLPPVAAGRHQDVWFQLGLVHMLKRYVVPPDPSAAGEPLVYHWFTNALMASHSQLSGVGASEVLLQLWPLTMALTFFLAGWAAGDLLSGREWAGPVAGLMSGVLSGGLQLTDRGVDMAGAMSIQGPTGTLAAVVMLGLVGPTVLIVRGQGGVGAWVAMVMLLGLSSGTKPTLLPIMAAGCGIAAVAAWRIYRRFPWRLVVIGGFCVGLFAAAASTLTGSTGGSRIQFLAALRVLPHYQAVTGDRSFPTIGGHVVPGIADGGTAMWFFAAVLIGWYVLVSLTRLLALAGIAIHPTRCDPAYWWAAGCVAAGAAITLVFSHTGYSEYHFLRTVMHLGPVTAVAIVARVLGDEIRHRKVWIPLACAGTAGAATAEVLRAAWPGRPPVYTPTAAAFQLLGPAVVMLLVLGVTMLVIRRVISPRRWPRALAIHAMCFLAAASVPTQARYFALATSNAVAGQQIPTGLGNRVYLTHHEQDAMLWLHDHAGPSDVAVSNVFCMPVRYKPGCPNDAYWVSGLSGVQQYLGGWAYAPANLAATKHRRSFLSLPPPWPDRLAHSLAAVQNPTPDLLDRLASEHSIDWIVADLRAGPVSPQLDQLADLAYSNHDVRIYHLR